MSRFSQSMSRPTQHHKDLFTPSWLWGNLQCHGMIRTECSSSPVSGHLRKTVSKTGMMEKGPKTKNFINYFWTGKHKHNLALGLLQLHRLPPSKPPETLPAHSASVTHNSVNKASSKRQERYAGMKDPSLMFSLWGCVSRCQGEVGKMQLYRVMQHFNRNNKPTRL